MSGHKRPRGDPSKTKKTTKSESSTISTFVSEQAKSRFNIFRRKNVISGRFVVIGDFDHFNLAQILEPHNLRVFFHQRKYFVMPRFPKYAKMTRDES